MSQMPVKRYRQLDDCEMLESPDGEWVELSALREVVEGMVDEFRQYERTLLEAHAGMTEEQLCGAAIALHWVKHRLLACLREAQKHG